MPKGNKLKKIKKQYGMSDIAREIRGLGVVIEHVDSKVSLVAEQYGDIKNALDSHAKTLDSHTEMIGSIKIDVEIIKTRLDSHAKILDSHTKTLDSHTEMIGSVKMDAEIIKTDVEFIKNSLKRKVDMDEFTALERRVALLEKLR
jgi:chromosome segregation ATPase